MKILSMSLIVALAAGLFASLGESRAQPSPQVVVAVENSHPGPVDGVPARALPRVARPLDERQKDSLVGLTLLLALRRGAHSR